MNTILFTLIGYLSGSILFSRAAAWIFHTQDLAANSEDHNPGAFNAFKNGGIVCGTFVLLGDIFKAFLPVYLYLTQYSANLPQAGLALVMWAPVFGHLFPIFYHFHGGKGIAAAFGSLLALWAGMLSAIPALSLAFLFLFFKLVVKISPDYYLTAAVFFLFPVMVWGGIQMGDCTPAVLIGSVLISSSVLVRLLLSKEPRPSLEVSLLWKR